MAENWAQLEEFPGYEVSDLGRVRTRKTKRLLSINPNAQGFYKVGLYSANGALYTRSVALLVLDAFQVPHHPHLQYNSVIHLNLDRSDNRLDNLRRRMRWFAMKYHRQFDEHVKVFEPNDTGRLRLDGTDEWLTFYDTCRTHGVLWMDLAVSSFNREYYPGVYPPMRFELQTRPFMV